MSLAIRGEDKYAPARHDRSQSLLNGTQATSNFFKTAEAARWLSQLTLSGLRTQNPGAIDGANALRYFFYGFHCASRQSKFSHRNPASALIVTNCQAYSPKR